MGNIDNMGVEGEIIPLDEKMRELCAKLYKDKLGKPYILTDGQLQIFERILKRDRKRVHLTTFTQYGKSATVALGVLTRAASYPERWIIVAGREKQAKIIMGYIIEHTFDNDYTKGKLEIGGEDIERLQRERSKNRLTFRHTDGGIGEIMVLSADSRNSQAAGESLMGFGGANVILDEASLIDDETEVKIFRMLGGFKDNFYLKIGNPFRRNHFYLDSINPDWYRLNIDYRQGIKEGRISEDFIREARQKPLFGILYENEFPPAEMIDEHGYVPLLDEKDLVEVVDDEMIKNKVMGVDPAGEGRDEAKWVVRDPFKIKVAATEKLSTPKGMAQRTMTIMIEENIPPHKVYVDSFGVGAALIGELAKAGVAVNAVNVGDRMKTGTEDAERFYNKRAWMFWELRDWAKHGGTFVKNPNWKELFGIKYRAELNRKLKIMSKDEMRRKGIMSPNTADAAMLTFSEGKDIMGNFKEYNVGNVRTSGDGDKFSAI